MPRNRRFATVEKSYITDIERERCKKVAAAYAELTKEVLNDGKKDRVRASDAR